MYFVDQKRIEATLTYIKTLQPMLNEPPLPSDLITRLALERAAMVTIEAIIDVGNQMIDGFIMRDPGSYEDIIDILLDERVLEKTDANALKQLIRYRKTLAYDYTTIDHTKLITRMKDSAASVARFPQAIRTYLKNELGTVTAFLPEE
ncbi:DUF86 domain-containing protein [Shouchella lonarensis]|uniref:Uncharacterized conserved protein YutE, UPF0331/DUF86 family n=1 Tax=Shouchella lonarensis TaxID=1464122 RepID=A0A1G6PBB7_9BACI|nr:DUF86 domain-containing protein [Shouchella lonarensis]SDC77453.1 Uncharacterized conserved protein YutE, UPF0331/DUF86 family [Shouchella lonarensis]